MRELQSAIAYLFQPVFLFALYAAFLLYLPELSMLCRLSLAFAASLALSLWLPFLFGLITPLQPAFYLSFGSALIGLVFFTVRTRTRWPAELTSAWNSLRNSPLTAAAGAALLISLIWMQYYHCFRIAEEGLYSQGPAWEDQSWHATLATSFGYGDNLSRLAYPIFPDWPLGYPFLSDLLAGAYLTAGLDVSRSFFLTAAFASIAFGISAFSLARSWLRTSGQALLAVLLMLLAGNFGFLNFIRDWFAAGNFMAAIRAHDYGNDWSAGLHYHIVLTAVVLVMRTSLFGMPIVFAVLNVLSDEVQGGNQKTSRRAVLFSVCGVLTGLLPLIHAHSFLVVGLSALCYACYARHRRDRRHWLFFFLPATVISLPQLLWTGRQLAQSATSFIRIEAGWMSPAQSIADYIVYWFWNGGFFLPFVVIALFLVPSSLRRRAMPLLLLFPLGQILAFQPYVYDNIKLFSFSNFAGAAVIVAVAARYWKPTAAFRLVYGAGFLLLISSGLLSITNQMIQPWLAVEREGIVFAEAVRRAVPPEAILLTGSALNHPVTTLAGRRVFLGYAGWLQQHGINYGEREALVQKAFKGEAEAFFALRQAGVQYVVLGPPEAREFPDLADGLIRSQAGEILTSGRYTLLRLRP